MEKMTVLIPTYNNEKTIKETIQSVLDQSYKDYTIIVVDDCSTDNTVNVVNLIDSDKIRVFINPVNLGCGRNLNKCVSLAETDIVYFLCGDDVIIDDNTFLLTALIFDQGVSIVSRTYYWFDTDPYKPVRRINLWNDRIKVIASFDQISGVSMRKSKMRNTFSSEPFMEMASVAYPIVKEDKSGYIEADNLAVRVHPMSGKVFENSPIKRWHDLLQERPKLIKDFVARNYVGLVQIKNYGTFKQLLREIKYLIIYRPLNLLSFKFWFFALGTIIIPRQILRKMVNLYRRVPK